MNKNRMIWIALCLASLLSLAGSWTLFTRAFPTLNVEMTMSRDAAVKEAGERAATLKMLPANARNAVRFNRNETAQNFIELEGGGKDALLKLMKDGVFQLTYWEVRFFREKEPSTTTVYFTPQGQPWGFGHYIPEKEPGAALDGEQARAIAEAAAKRDWNLDLSPEKSPYDLVEKSFEKRPGGRVDHFLVYERRDQRLGINGEGRVRLTLTVAGDRLVGLSHSLKVPQGFERRYAEMRSFNNAISTAGSIVMALLFVLGGCVLGLVLLKREHAVIARPAVKWAGFIAVLLTAALLNRIPSSWFDYDTAVPASTFLAGHVIAAGGAFIGLLLLLSMSFMAAESLSRKAFPHHPQLWKLWTVGAGNSVEVLGRTAGGYLWVGFDLLFIVVFYYITQHYLGWWSPLESLVDPNVLAMPMPWVTPVATALQAGFLEECLFRAVPLASAALLGDWMGKRFGGRFGARRTWIVIGLVVEALVFGAGHANYAQQPAYARPVELFIPAIAWGLVYLRFGLLPGIVFHYVFDLLLMSMPIFALNAPELNFDRAMVILCGAVPMLAVLVARYRAGRWQALPPAFLNAAWQRTAPVPASAPMPEAETTTAESTLWKRTRTALPFLGVLGLALWLTFTPMKQNGLPLYLDRAEAEAAADKALQERGVKLAEWKRFSTVVQNREDGDKFVWKEGGAKAYEALMGTYLAPPRWEVRYLRFDGDVGARAEKWIAIVENGVDGKAGKVPLAHVRLVDHQIPEAAAGASLAVEQARDIARRAIRQRFGRDPAELREISAIQSQRPNRKDWRFIFADDRNYPLKSGEARIDINIAGDEVSYVGRYLHVPEEWTRADREGDSQLGNAKNVIGIFYGLFMLGIMITAVVRAAHGHIDKRRFWQISAVAFGLGVISRTLGWQEIAAGLNTETPLAVQIGTQVATHLLGMLLVSLVIGLFAGVSMHGRHRSRLGSTRFSALLIPSLALAALWSGVGAALNASDASNWAYWQNVTLLNQLSPIAANFITGIMGTLQRLAEISFVLVLLRELSANFTKRRWLVLLMLLPFGMRAGMAASDMNGLLMQAAGHSLFIIAMYLLAARFEPRTMLFAMMPSIFAPVITAIMAPMPNSLLLATSTLLAIGLTAAWWMRRLEDGQHPSTSPNAGTAEAIPAEAIT